jgi:hypothetical protein
MCLRVRYELRFYIPEDDILHSYHCENLKSYLSLSILFAVQVHRLQCVGVM